MTQKNFETALTKGKIGESIMRSILERKGWSVFMPVTKGPHHFDIMATLNKERAIAMDVKTKARMNKYNATGVNQKHFEEYQRFSQLHNMPFWIVFVDEAQGTIYGNEIKELEIPYLDTVDDRSYPWVMGTLRGVKIRLWSLERMIAMGEINDDVIRELESLSQRSYEYSPAVTKILERRK